MEPSINSKDDYMKSTYTDIKNPINMFYVDENTSNKNYKSFQESHQEHV